MSDSFLLLFGMDIRFKAAIFKSGVLMIGAEIIGKVIKIYVFFFLVLESLAFKVNTVRWNNWIPCKKVVVED